MSKREVFSFKTAQPADLFTAVTAEAWLSPDLAADLAKDKVTAISLFAREHGYAVPGTDEIEKWEMPVNPIGDLDIGVGPNPIVAATATTEGCPNTAQETCPNTTQPGCPSTASGCGPGPSFSPSNCSVGCATFGCSFDCPSVGYPCHTQMGSACQP